MREKIVLGRRAILKRVRLPDGTSFLARYERISRSSLPGNIRITRTRIVGPRNRQAPRIRKKSVRFNLGNTPTQDRAWRIKKEYRRLKSGKGLPSTIANLGLTMGSKAINSGRGKKLIDKGIGSLPDIVKVGASKIKNKNIQRALDSDIAKHVVEEAKHKSN